MPESNKTEKATPKRRQTAREKGQVARSRELPNVLAMAGELGALAIISQGAITHWTSFFRNVLHEAATGTIESNGPVLAWSTSEVFRWILPALSAALVCSIGAAAAQGGITFAPAALELKFDRFNPANRLGQIFSPIGLSNLLKSLLPFAAITWVGINDVRGHWMMITHATYLSFRLFAELLGSMIYEAAWKAGLIMLGWSGVEYLLTWRKMEDDLKMSHEEIREENKSTEGSPLTKRRLRRKRMEMRRRQSLAAAKTATVVITNPTHYAVALRYTPDMVAPEVVAKGMNLLAEEIKALAIENGIMLMENKPLAQALYKSVEVGEMIPSKLYQAVADILVVVFKAQAEVRQQEARRRSRNASGQVIR